MPLGNEGAQFVNGNLRRFGKHLGTRQLFALVGNLFGGFFVLHHDEDFAGFGDFLQTDDGRRSTRADRLGTAAVIEDHRTYPPVGGTDDHIVSDMEGTVFDDNIGDRPKAFFNRTFDDNGFGGTGSIGFELHYLCLQQDRLKQIIDPQPGMRRDRDKFVLAAPVN